MPTINRNTLLMKKNCSGCSIIMYVLSCSDTNVSPQNCKRLISQYWHQPKCYMRTDCSACMTCQQQLKWSPAATDKCRTALGMKSLQVIELSSNMLIFQKGPANSTPSSSHCMLTQPPHQSPCKALKPWSGTRVEPVTNCKSLALLSSSNVSTACQNHFTILLSAMQCFRRVFDFQSFRSILSRPPMISC